MARRLFRARTLVLGGLAVAAALKNREKVSGLLGGGTSTPEPYPAPSAAPVGTPAVEHDEAAPPPPISTFDAAGPPANTATHVPAPEPVVHDPSGAIDEAAEEAAAAAEAANIGGGQPDYPSDDDFAAPADEAFRPREEAGEGWSEGQELSEADLVDNAEPSAGDPIEGERQIDDVIEAQDDPFAGEALEGSPEGSTEPAPREAGPDENATGEEPTTEQPAADTPGKDS